MVPRIPGGEITPDKLIVIGNVAKKHGLYTKITGAQRIDLFGAHLADLPLIWEELIDAGFESGHAYGKALRTVKSCVGSTWCRFGLHDSVSFAIEIEERYRGIRAPHKFKGGVSGCIRECAEAQAKDFGLIATEKGWNLFFACYTDDVPSNGGACVKYKDSQIAIFNFTRRGEWYATQNLCPHKQQMVLSRGIIGSTGEACEPKVACPFHKKIFSLETGECLSGDNYQIKTYPVVVQEGKVYIEIS